MITPPAPPYPPTIAEVVSITPQVVLTVEGIAIEKKVEGVNALATNSESETRLAQLPRVPEAPLPQEIDPPPASVPPTLSPTPEEPPTPDTVLPITPEVPSVLPDDEQVLTVTSISFEGNSLFDAKELEFQLTDGVGWAEQSLTLSALLQIAETVADIYRRDGYSTSGAVIRIPEVTRQTGMGEVVIEVIEGTVEAVRIGGNRRLNQGYIRSRLPVEEGEPLNVRRLQEGLQLLQIDPLIERVSSELTAGAVTGSSILTVEIDEAPSFSLPIRLDNSRTPSVGTLQGQISVNEGNLFGIGDRIDVGYSLTEGSDVINASYQVPINPANGTFSVSFNRAVNDVVTSTFFDIDDDGNGPDIESESIQVEASLRQPIVRKIRNGQFQELALGLSGSYRESQSFLFDEPFRFSLSSDGDGETTITALRLFQDYTLQDATQVLALRSQFSLGVDALDSTIQDDIPGVEDIPDSEFFAWRGQAQWVRRLSSDTTLLLRSNLQLANDGLTSSEQFSLGGVGTVRGYRQDQTLADNGFFASTEVRFPVMQVPEWQGTLQLAPFVDFGVGWNSGGRSAPDDNTLASVGVGLQWLQGDRNQLRARLDWGIPLIPIDSDGDSFQEQGFHFSVEYDLF